LATLRAAAAHCTACPLYARATQTVFGEGPDNAPLMLVGEQPGDHEDRAGRPSSVRPHVLATVHPSALLRARDNERDAAIAGFIADLATVAPLLRVSARYREEPELSGRVRGVTGDTGGTLFAWRQCFTASSRFALPSRV
jgi:hypothetical protein